MDNGQVTAVLGVGPGLGAAIARRFARAGHGVALLARSEEKLNAVRDEITAGGGTAVVAPCDATEPASVAAAFEKVRESLGPPDVLVYNAGAFQMGGILETDPDTFETAWRANCFGGFLAMREAVPAMVERGRGTVLLTGATASTRGSARFACLAVGKFGLRALAQSAARELGPKGVHVAHVLVDGQIDTPRVRGMFPDREAHTFLQPEAIAETYWQLHTQDRTAWTLEMDLRPAVERF